VALRVNKGLIVPGLVTVHSQEVVERGEHVIPFVFVSVFVVGGATTRGI